MKLVVPMHEEKGSNELDVVIAVDGFDTAVTLSPSLHYAQAVDLKKTKMIGTLVSWRAELASSTPTEGIFSVRGHGSPIAPL